MSEAKTRFTTLLPRVMDAVRYSLALSSQDILFFRSIDPDVESLTSETLAIFLALIDQLRSQQNERENASTDSNSDFKWDNIESFLDSIHERLEIAIEKHETRGHAQNYHRSADPISKPQLLFDSKVDNSDSHPFVPKLTSKPHSLKPIEASLRQDSNGQYPHPYEYEVLTQPYPEDILISSEPTEPQDLETTSAIWVSTKDQLDSMIKDLAQSDVIAVDLEHHDLRSYYGITCLMQISTRAQDWVVDVIALRSHMESLNQVFTNPRIIKVFHGAFMDIIWLQRDFGLYIVSLFDTYHAAKVLGFPKFSLAFLLERYAAFKASKKFQLADWRVRPLSSAMMHYARADTHFLIFIYEQLRNMLLASGNEKMSLVLHSSRKVALRKFEFHKFRSDNDFDEVAQIMRNYNINPNMADQVKQAFIWRDQQARILDESPRFIMPNSSMVRIASASSPVDAEIISSLPNVNVEMCDLQNLADSLNKLKSKSSLSSSPDLARRGSLSKGLISIESSMGLQEDFLAGAITLLCDSSKVFSSQFLVSNAKDTRHVPAPNPKITVFKSSPAQELKEPFESDLAATSENSETNTSIAQEDLELRTLTGHMSTPHPSKAINSRGGLEKKEVFDYEQALKMQNEHKSEAARNKKRNHSFDPLAKSELLKRDKQKKRRTFSGRSTAFSK